MTITLTVEQLSKLKEFVDTDEGTPNYAGMYQYIFDQVGEQMSPKQAYWFEQAAKINAYLNKPDEVEPSQSAYFIQQMNKYALGGSASDGKIADISNAIGANVYQDIVGAGGTTP